MTVDRIRQKVERGMPLYTDDAQALLDEIDRLRPFHVGDRVYALVREDERWGWLLGTVSNLARRVDNDNISAVHVQIDNGHEWNCSPAMVTKV